MTRQEFIDTVDYIDDLLEFCSEIGFVLEEVYTEEDRNDYINRKLFDMVRVADWEEVKDFLNSQSTGYDFYLRDDWDDFEGRDGTDIDDLKQEVLDYADEYELFDPEDEEEEPLEDEPLEDETEEEYIDEEDDEPVELGCDMNDFLISGNDVMKAIRDRADADQREYDLAMQKFLNAKVAARIPS